MKQFLLFFVLLCFSLSSLSESQTTRPEVNPYGQAFSSAMGLINIEMATLKEKNELGGYDVIVRFFGLIAYQHDLNNKTLLLHGNKKGNNFSYQKDGKPYSLITKKSPWGSWEYTQIHFGNRSYDLYPLKRSSHVRPEHLVTKHLKAPLKDQNKDPVNPYGISFTSSPSNLTVSLVFFTEKNDKGLHDVLLRVTGAEAYNEGIDGKVIRLTANRTGNNGVSYSYLRNGKPWHILTSEKDYYQLYLTNKTFNLSGNAISNIRPLHLLTAYKKQKSEL